MRIAVLGHHGVGHACLEDIAYGARYWFAVVPGLTVLSTLGLRWIVTGSSPGPARLRRVVPAGALIVPAVVLMMILWNST